MTIDEKFIDQFVNVTSKAAIASYHLIGKNDKIAADKAAVDAMRAELNQLNINGKIVIGEGELDEAPMLYIDEKIGKMDGPEIDIYSPFWISKLMSLKACVSTSSVENTFFTFVNFINALILIFLVFILLFNSLKFCYDVQNRFVQKR